MLTGLHWSVPNVGVMLVTGLVGASGFLTRGNSALGSKCKFWWLCILFGVRFGEALHPGPMDAQTGDGFPWAFGIANPTGLSKKLDQVAHLRRDCWVFSETHLTQQSCAHFKRGLAALKSGFTSFVPGALRSDHAGEYSGVLLLSRSPARRLVHKIDEGSFATGRIQVCGVLAGQQWVQLGMLYGVPKGHKHAAPALQTDILLEQLVERLAHQTSGPRIIAGDLNHSLEELPQLKKLHSYGWREVQEVASYRWGQLPQPTGRGSAILDQVWVSPELVSAICAVQVCRDKWADHATVEVDFRLDTAAMQADVWRMPQQFQWPKDWYPNVTWDSSREPTDEYRRL